MIRKMTRLFKTMHALTGMQNVMCAMTYMPKMIRALHVEVVERASDKGVGVHDRASNAPPNTEPGQGDQPASSPQADLPANPSAPLPGYGNLSSAHKAQTWHASLA
jgi:hypothetical protein